MKLHECIYARHTRHASHAHHARHARHARHAGHTRMSHVYNATWMCVYCMHFPPTKTYACNVCNIWCACVFCTCVGSLHTAFPAQAPAHFHSLSFGRLEPQLMQRAQKGPVSASSLAALADDKMEVRVSYVAFPTAFKNPIQKYYTGKRPPTVWGVGRQWTRRRKK